MPYNPSGDLEFDRSEFSHHRNRIRYSTPSVYPENNQVQPVPQIGWNEDQAYLQHQPQAYGTSVPFSYTPGPTQAWNTSPPPGHSPRGKGQLDIDYIQKKSQVTTVDDFYSGKRESIKDQTSEADEFDGSLKRRKCRDVVCLGLFVAFIGLMAVVAGYALITGDLNRFTDGSSDCTDADIRQRVAINRFINGSHVPQNVLLDEEKRDFFEDAARQLEKSWPSLVWMSLVAVGLSILVTILLRVFAAVIVWIVIGIFVIAGVAGAIAMWIVYATTENATEGPFWDKNRKEGLLVIACIVSILTLIFLIVLLAMRRRIVLVIQLFKEAGKAVHAIPLIVLQPVWTFFIQVGVTSIFLSVAVFIETSRVKDDETNQCRRPAFAVISRYLNIFAYFWITQFVVGCQHLVVAGAIAKWFFTRKKSNLRAPILSSIFNLVRYHLGSVAFGSLIIAIVKFIRYILNSIKKRVGGASKLAACCLCCCSCCLWCLDKVLQFINRNAYIEIAIYGYGYCPAAKKAFKVIVNNALRLAAINSIGDFVLFLGKFTIVGLTALCGYYIFKARLNAGESLDVEWTLILVGTVFAYFIAHCFISMYEMAIDTIFICFCEDMEVNDGVNKPYFMSKGLMSFVKANQKYDKKKETKEDKLKTRSQ